MKSVTDYEIFDTLFSLEYKEKKESAQIMQIKSNPQSISQNVKSLAKKNFAKIEKQLEVSIPKESIKKDSVKVQAGPKSDVIKNIPLFDQENDQCKEKGANGKEGCGPIPPVVPEMPDPPKPKPSPGPALPPCNPSHGSCPTPFSAPENKAAE